MNFSRVIQAPFVNECAQNRAKRTVKIVLWSVNYDIVLLETNMAERCALTNFAYKRNSFIRRIYIYIFIFVTNLFNLVNCKRSKLVKYNNFHETATTIIIHSLPPQFIYFTLSSSTYPQCLQYRYYYLHYISTSVYSLIKFVTTEIYFHEMTTAFFFRDHPFNIYNYKH